MLVDIFVDIFHGRYYKLDGVKALNSASPVYITAGLASSPAAEWPIMRCVGPFCGEVCYEQDPTSVLGQPSELAAHRHVGVSTFGCWIIGRAIDAPDRSHYWR